MAMKAVLASTTEVSTRERAFLSSRWRETSAVADRMKPKSMKIWKKLVVYWAAPKVPRSSIPSTRD